MDFNAKEHSELVLEIKKRRAEFGGYWREYLHYYWLEGFMEIAGGTFLNQKRVADFLVEEIRKYPSFTPVIPIEIREKYQKLIREDRLNFIQIPLHKDFHLQFPMLDAGENFIFLYEFFSGIKATKSKKFPVIEIRRSLNIEEMVGEEVVIRDNIVQPHLCGKNLMIRGYNSMKKFIKKCR